MVDLLNFQLLSSVYNEDKFWGLGLSQIEVGGILSLKDKGDNA